MVTAKSRKVRATVEFEIIVPEKEDDRKYIESCYRGTVFRIIDIKKVEDVKK